MEKILLHFTIFQKTLEEEEDLVVGSGGGRRPARSLLTSYTMSSAFGNNRLANLRAAFSVSLNTLWLSDMEHFGS